MVIQVEKEDLILVSADELAKLLSISPRHLFRCKANSKLPRPIKIGRSTRWRLSDIRLWQKWGCCNQKEFEARKSALSRT